MQFADLTQKSDKELRETLAEQQEYLRTLQFKVSERQLKTIHEIKKTKQNIARIHTALAKRAATARTDA